MPNPDRVFVPIPLAARRLGLPEKWVLAEARAGRIPSIKAGRRLLVHLAAAETTLAERAGALPRELAACNRPQPPPSGPEVRAPRSGPPPS